MFLFAAASNERSESQAPPQPSRMLANEIEASRREVALELGDREPLLVGVAGHRHSAEVEIAAEAPRPRHGGYEADHHLRELAGRARRRREIERDQPAVTDGERTGDDLAVDLGEEQ